MAACCWKLIGTGFPRQNLVNNSSRALDISRRFLQRSAASIVGDGFSSKERERFKKETIQVISPESLALKHHDYFGVRGLVNVEDMFKARCHMGHKAGCRNPHMTPYLFGTRMDVDIIDLDKTVPLLQDALNIIAHVTYRKGIILFINRERKTMPLVEQAAKDCGEYAHCRHWSSTSFLDAAHHAGQTIRLPELLIFLNTLNNVFDTHKAVTDASKMLIPTVGVVDTNANPQLISYPIPGNDDSETALKYYLSLFTQTIMKAKEKRESDDQKFS